MPKSCLSDCDNTEQIILCLSRLVRVRIVLCKICNVKCLDECKQHYKLLHLHSLQNLMAKALYDNVPESPEELAFRKGDILTVIEQNTGGLEGWWLCSLHGRQGIAPGNRLKLLIGPMFEGQRPASPSPPQGHALQQRPLTPQSMYQVPPSHQSPQGQGIYQIPPSKDVYQVPQRSALTADGTPSKVN